MKKMTKKEANAELCRRAQAALAALQRPSCQEACLAAERHLRAGLKAVREAYK